MLKHSTTPKVSSWSAYERQYSETAMKGACLEVPWVGIGWGYELGSFKGSMGVGV